MPGDRTDISLIMRVEQARFHQADFSDAHWVSQVLAVYRNACQVDSERLVMALEEVLRAFCQSSAAGKERAAYWIAQGAPLPVWLDLGTSADWPVACAEVNRRGLVFGPSGEITQLGDGD